MLATSGVSGTATGSSTATTSTGVSNVAITGSTTGLSATNYDFTKADGTLTINKAPATVTANSDTKTYTGGSQSVSGFTASGLVNAESDSVLNGVTAGASGSNAGSYTATAGVGSYSGNYTLSFVDGNLTINKAPAVVTANSDTKTYTGGSQSVSGFTASGLVNGESTSVLSGVSAGASGTNAGSYTATAGVGSYSGNYTLSFVDGKLTINKAPLIIVGSKVYDGSSAMPGTYLTGLGVNGETFALTGAGSPGNLGNKNVQSGSTLSSVLGLVLSTSSNGGLTGNYSDLSTTGSSINVTPKALTGSIAPGSSAYGASLAPGAATLTGVISGDSVTTGAVALNTSGNTSTSGHLKAGSYTGIESLNATLAGTDAGNYTFAGATGNYTVSQAALTGSVAPGSSAYGAALTPGAATLSGVLLGDVVAPATVAVNTSGSTSTSGHLKAGSYTGIESVSSALSGTDSGNYTFAGAAGNYTVSQAALTGSVVPGSSAYGAALTPGAATLSGVLSGDSITTGAVTINTSGNTSTSGHLKAGSYTGIESVSATLSGTDAGNYTFAGASGNYSVGPVTLTGSIAPGSSAYGATLLPGAATLSGVLPGDVVAPGAVAVNTTGSTSTSGHLKAGSYTGIESVSATLSGADAGNYTFAGASGNYSVSTLSLPITGITASNKVYDTTTSASLLGTASVATLNNDVVNVSGVGTGAFADANVGTGKAVTVSGYTLAGADAGNYAVRQPAGLTADINPAQQQPVESVTTQLATTVFSPKAETRPDALHLLPTITVTQSGSPNTAPPVADAAAFVDSLPPAATGPNSSSTASSTDSSSPPPSSNTVVNTMMTIGGGMGPALQIITGGIRLPANVAIILQ